MDPWEAVKWIAIFRLILPEALFRLCGGRIENLGELQPLAVKAGLNGVMMGNFLTTLGSEPEDDRRDVRGARAERRAPGRQRRRTRARTTARAGSTARRRETPIDELIDRQDEANFWDPSTQLRHRRKTSRAAPPATARPNQRSADRESAASRARAGGEAGMSDDIEERLEDLRGPRPLPPAAHACRARRGRACCSTASPVLLLCSNNYLGLADHPRVREAAAEAAMRYGAGAGASRLVSGNMTIHRRLEEQLADVQGRRGVPAVRLGLPRERRRRVRRSRGEGDVVFSDALNHASIIDGCRLSRAETFVYDHCDIDHLEWGLRQAEGRGALIVTDGVFSMDGDVAPLPEIVELAQRYDARVMVDEAHGTGCVGPGGRGLVAEAGLEDEVDVSSGTLGKALGSYGAYVLLRQADGQVPGQHRAHADLLDRPAAARRRRGAWPRSSCCASSPGGSRSCSATRRCCARRWPSQGMPVEPGETQIVPLIVGRRRRRRWRPASARSSGACSPRRSARRPCPRARRGCGWR